MTGRSELQQDAKTDDRVIKISEGRPILTEGTQETTKDDDIWRMKIKLTAGLHELPKGDKIVRIML